MKTLKMEIVDDRAIRPNGSQFELTALSFLSKDSVFYLAKTGIKISLEDNMTIHITSLLKDVFVVGWNMAEELEVLVASMSDEMHTKLLYNMIDQPFARVSIVEFTFIPVRFVEFAKEGGRMICGESKEVKNGESTCC